MAGFCFRFVFGKYLLYLIQDCGIKFASMKISCFYLCQFNAGHPHTGFTLVKY